MKILSCADIHMGRIPSVPYGENLTSYSSWYAIVDKAIELNVDVLTLSGDVVEHEDQWFEAYGPLLSGLVKLGDAGIQVIGVGGNHDYSVLPSLARESEHIQILGLGGQWEHFDYKGVRFVGWSFAERRVQHNPFDSFTSSYSDTDLSLFGLLHCDVGAAEGSSYAPVSLHDFSRSLIPQWALGHIHKGGVYNGGSVLYCGSPFALDSNEEGPHGVWLLEKEEQGPWKHPTHIPLCPYRFERVKISLQGSYDQEDVKKALTHTLRTFASTLSLRGTLFCSLTFEGVVSRSLDMSKTLSQEDVETLFIKEGETVIRTLYPYSDTTVLDIDLKELALGVGATSLLAQKLLDEDEIQLMIELYKQLEQESYTASAFSQLHASQGTRSEDEYRHLVQQAAKRLLFAMLNIKEGER